MNCKKCGFKMPDGARFCIKCGSEHDLNGNLILQNNSSEYNIEIENNNFSSNDRNQIDYNKTMAVCESVEIPFDTSSLHNQGSFSNSLINNKNFKIIIAICLIGVVAIISIIFINRNENKNNENALLQSQSNGATYTVKNGWVGDYYYIDDKMVQNDWLYYNGKWYYLTDNGKCVRYDWKKIGDDYYYFDANGSMKENAWIDNEYYVGTDGKMLKNAMTPDGYMVGADGRYVESKNSLINLFKLYDEYNKNSGAIRKDDGSYFIMSYMGYDGKMVRQQLPALFDANGNLWIVEHIPGLGAAGDDGSDKLQIKYLNGVDSEIYKRDREYYRSEWSPGGMFYENEISEQMFNTYENLQDHYSIIKQNFNISN